MFSGGKLWQISDQMLLVSKVFVNSCLFAFFKMHMINLEGKFGKSSAIRQICQCFPPSNIHIIATVLFSPHVASYDHIEL